MTAGRILKRTLLVLAGLLVLLFFVLWRLPPAQLLERTLPRDVSWTSVSGNLFDASVSRLAIEQQALEQVDWRINPFSLLIGMPKIDVEIIDPGMDVTARVNHSLWSSQTSFERIAGRADSLWIQHFINQPGLRLSGDLEFDLARIGFSDAGRINSIEGEARWVAAAIEFDSRVELGTVLSDWQTENSRIRASISDQGGVLEILGNVHFDEDSYHIELDLKPRYPRTDLVRALALFGSPDESGVTRVRISGPLLSIFGTWQ